MRINGTVVEDPRPGKFYLLRRSPEQGSDSYHLSDTPGRNSSHEERFNGWLGTTNNVAWYAENAIEVSRGETGRWRYKRIFAVLVDAEKLDEAIQILEVYKVRGEPTKVTAVIGKKKLKR